MMTEMERSGGRLSKVKQPTVQGDDSMERGGQGTNKTTNILCPLLNWKATEVGGRRERERTRIRALKQPMYYVGCFN